MQPLVFLYTEIAAYTLACLRELVNRGYEIHVFRYPVNNEAPFEFEIQKGIHFHDRFNFNRQSLFNAVSRINPHIIFCSGWTDKDYVEIAKHFKKNKVTTVLCMDNKWEATPKQVIASLISPFILNPAFDFAWVPGESQKKFALKLGFPEQFIFKGFYCADTPLFQKLYAEANVLKGKKFPRVFLYTGRYYEFKGLKMLWKAFEEFKRETANEWQLWCAGTGDLEPVSHKDIRHLGFIQPPRFRELIRECGVFIFPSQIEPWGVAVHEFAVAGFPMILSDQVGSAEFFLKDNLNGFSFKSKKPHELKNALMKISELPDHILYEMGVKSHEFGMAHQPANWADCIERFKK